MYLDAAHIFTVAPPAATVIATGSVGYDLNPDFGVGAFPRRSPLPGAGEEFFIHVQVTTGFVQGGAGVPILQIHAVLSDTASPSVVTSNMVIIGSTMSAQHIVAQTPGIQVGYHVAQLALNNQFYIRCNPWTTPMGRNGAGATIDGKILRYLGLIIVMPNFHVADTFATGQIQGRFVKQSDVSQSFKDFAYPVASKIVG